MPKPKNKEIANEYSEPIQFIGDQFQCVNENIADMDERFNELSGMFRDLQDSIRKA